MTRPPLTRAVISASAMSAWAHAAPQLKSNL